MSLNNTNFTTINIYTNQKDFYKGAGVGSTGYGHASSGNGNDGLWLTTSTLFIKTSTLENKKLKKYFVIDKFKIEYLYVNHNKDPPAVFNI